MTRRVMFNLQLPIDPPAAVKDDPDWQRFIAALYRYADDLRSDIERRSSYGVYTPTLSNTTNVTASTAYECQYLRVGQSVTVSGKVDITPTAAAPTDTVLGISVPIASNFGAEEDCSGVGACHTVNQSGGIRASAANDRAEFRFAAASNTSRPFSFTFTYQIIS